MQLSSYNFQKPRNFSATIISVTLARLNQLTVTPVSEESLTKTDYPVAARYPCRRRPHG